MVEIHPFKVNSMTSFTYFEPRLDGHSTQWARLILEQAAQDQRVTKVRLVATAQLVERLTETCQTSQIHSEIISSEALACLTSGSLWAQGRAQWRAALALRDKTGGDVFLPFFDHAVIAAALDRAGHSGPGKISGVIFRPPNNFAIQPSWPRKLDTLRRWTSYSLAQGKVVESLFTLDETASNGKGSAFKKALKFLPDIAPDVAKFNFNLQLPRPDCRAIYLLFGSLSARKGIFQIVEAWALMDPSFHKANVLRLAGKIATEDRSIFLKRVAHLRQLIPEMMIEIEDRFLTEDELAQNVCAAKVILAPYQNHVGSSGVLYWAAAAGKPVLSQKTGLMGFLVHKYGLGQSVETSIPVEIAKALGQDQLVRFDPSFCHGHSPFDFAATVLVGAIST
jgi:hypothetical protein